MIFDEADKYISESELIGQVVETIREMRHRRRALPSLARTRFPSPDP